MVLKLKLMGRLLLLCDKLISDGGYPDYCNDVECSKEADEVTCLKKCGKGK